MGLGLVENIDISKGIDKVVRILDGIRGFRYLLGLN